MNKCSQCGKCSNNCSHQQQLVKMLINYNNEKNKIRTNILKNNLLKYKAISGIKINPDDNKITVLYDDIMINEKQIKNIIENTGFQLLLAEDGLAGMELLQQEKADLLILDINLPYISGIGLVQLVKQQNSAIPIICITGQGLSSQKIAEHDNADLVLHKPFEMQTLLKHINELLS